MIKVFLTDDHEMYLEGLALLLNKQEGIQVTGTALSGTLLLGQLAAMDVDILLLDVSMPDIEEEDLLKRIRRIKPQQKIAYLTLLRGTRYIHKLMKHNIQGYILKNAPITELRDALYKINSGENYFSKDIHLADTEEDFRNTISIDGKNITEILSKREQEILKLICKEYSNADIAAQLFLSISTIETHRKNLISKLGVNNTVGLVKFALKHKLID
jgi:two-component system, NarL family, response regulator NreC